jgi:hypothetical protein
MKKQLPDRELLTSLFLYDPETGFLIWRVWNGGSAHAGTRAGSFCKRHRVVNVQGGHYVEHRIIWKIVTGNDPIEEIDHANGIGDDNRWVNLREASRAENAHNLRTPSTNTSGFKGVHWHAGARRWRATIKCGGNVPIHLGYFDDPSAAHAAYCAAADKLHGEFARHD